MPLLSTSALNVCLRAAGLVFRFGLTVFIARYLGVESLGVASFLFAAVSVTPPLLSFGLHYRLNREIVGRPLEEAVSRLRDRLALHLLILAALALVAGGGVAFGDFLPAGSQRLAAWIALFAFLIGSLELVAFELNHGLISLKQSVLANAFLFFRSSSWVPLFVAVAYVFQDMRSIPALLAFWMCGFVMAYTFLLHALRHWPWQAIITRPPDYPWLFRDFRKSFLIYCSDIAMVLALYADRVIIGGLLGIGEAGIYFFYWSLSAGIHQLIQSSVTQPAAPELVTCARSGDQVLLESLRHHLRRSLVWSLVLGLGCALTVFLLVGHLGRPEIASHFHLLPILLVGTLFSARSDTLYLALYAKHRDVAVASSNFFGLGAALLFTTVGILAFGLVGAPIGMVANAVCSCLFRTVLLKRALADGQAAA